MSDKSAVQVAAGRVRRLGRGLVRLTAQAAGTKQIWEIATSLRLIARAARRGPRPSTDYRAIAGADLNLDAMAAEAGIPRREIERMIRNRRRQTAASALLLSGGTLLFLGIWLHGVYAAPSVFLEPVYAACLLGGACCLALNAFYNALSNWQLRTLRMGSAREFLVTNDSWWPS